MTQRSMVGSIYGYLICLIAVLLFVRSAVGVVASSFAIANPGIATARNVEISVRGGPFGGPGMEGPMVRRFPGAMMRSEPGFGVRGLVISLVVLVIAVFLFVGHWRWLHDITATTPLRL